MLPVCGFSVVTVCLPLPCCLLPTEEIIRALIHHCGDELVTEQAESPYVQSEAELLSHPEYIAQDNQWMQEFLTRLEKHYPGGSGRTPLT
ncbi:MAG: hypothetical protein LBG24_07240 [Treponema sp.]|nr:hypothetical protein [Treponema sp.]